MLVPLIVIPHRVQKYKEIKCKRHELVSVDFTIRTLIHFPQYESITCLREGTVIQVERNLLPSCDYVFQRKITIRARDYYSNQRNINDYVIDLNKSEKGYSNLINEVINKVLNGNDREYNIEDFVFDTECHYTECEYTKEVPI